MSPCIWAVGGGKGGVGKSVLTSSLGIAVARRGRRTILVDADLGGANLHTLLGVPSPRRTLSDFLDKRVGRLDDVVAPTGVPGLSLISGARALVEMANPKHVQKEKILRHVRNLDADHVIYDLGAGSAFNVLDFFLAGHRGVLVVVPEPTSVENAYHFLRAAFFRRVKAASPDEDTRATVRRVFAERRERGIRSPRELLAAVAQEDPDAGRTLWQAIQDFHPRIVVNQVRNPDDRRLGEQIRQASQSFFGTPVSFLGAVPYDPRVRDAVRRRQHMLDLHPHGDFARSVEALVEGLMDEGERRR